MKNVSETSVEAKVSRMVELVLNVAGWSWVRDEQIINRGAATPALVELLEHAGMRVDRERGEGRDCDLTALSDASDPSDLSDRLPSSPPTRHPVNPEADHPFARSRSDDPRFVSSDALSPVRCRSHPRRPCATTRSWRGFIV